jgi:ATP-dependent protease ClpP protease subunit
MVDPTRRPAALTRRGAVLTLIGGAMATPWIARAQGVPPGAPPVVIPPHITIPPGAPSAPTVPLSAPATIVRPPVTTGIDKTKIYYVFFDQAIDTAAMLKMRRQLATLVEAGVGKIVLVINSGGGQVNPALITYSFIRSLPAQIDTHAQGFVASAANVVFLAGENRSADRGTRFLFHPSQTTLSGQLNEQQVHEQTDQVDTVAAMMRQIYQDRTTLTDAQLQSFDRGQVIFTADQAKQSGIIQTVADLKLPGDQAARILFLD